MARSVMKFRKKHAELGSKWYQQLQQQRGQDEEIVMKVHPLDYARGFEQINDQTYYYMLLIDTKTNEITNGVKIVLDRPKSNVKAKVLSCSLPCSLARFEPNFHVKRSWLD